MIYSQNNSKRWALSSLPFAQSVVDWNSRNSRVCYFQHTTRTDWFQEGFLSLSSDHFLSLCPPGPPRPRFPAHALLSWMNMAVVPAVTTASFPTLSHRLNQTCFMKMNPFRPSSFPSSCFSFPICKMGIITVSTSSFHGEY